MLPAFAHLLSSLFPWEPAKVELVARMKAPYTSRHPLTFLNKLRFFIGRKSMVNKSKVTWFVGGESISVKTTQCNASMGRERAHNSFGSSVARRPLNRNSQSAGRAPHECAERQLVEQKASRKLHGLQGWAKEWALGCVNPASWLPPAA